MTDRDLPVTEDELHAYVDGELPADRQPAVEAWLASHPDDMARVAAGARSPTPFGRATATVATEPVPVAAEPAPDRARRPLVARHGGGGRDRGIPGRRRSPDGWRAAHRGAAAPGRDAHHRRARRLQALRRRGPPSRRGAGQRAGPSHAVALEARRLRAAHPRSRAGRAEARRRPAAAGPARRGRVLHV